MSNRNPAAYTGMVAASTSRQGDIQFDASDFSVVNGVVSLGGTGNIENLTPQSGSVTPAAGLVALSGATGEMSTSGTGNTITFTLDEGVPRSVAVSMTAAEIKALATTPIELVAAPGAGKVIQFMGAELKLVAGSEVLAESGDNLGIKFTDASGVQVSATIESTGFIDQAANTYTTGIAANDAIVAATAAENQALVLDNLGSNFTGNASNDATLEVSVVYRVVEL